MLPGRSASLLCSLACLLATAPLTSVGQQVAPGSTEVGVAKAVPLVDGNYQLSANEVIKVTVFQEEDLNSSARISEDGTIQLPLIGTVQVAGKTVRQAAVT